MQSTEILDNIYLLYQKNGYDKAVTIALLVINFELTTEVAEEYLTVAIKRQISLQEKNRLLSEISTILNKYQ